MTSPSKPSLPDLTRTVAVLRALNDLVKEQLDYVKADTLDALADIGAERVAAKLPDGSVVAHVTRVMSVPAVGVTDERALMEWARTHAPDMIELIPEQTTVIPAHEMLKSREVVELIAKHAIRDGRAITADGELTPGIGVLSKAPYIMVKFAKEGRQMIAEGLRQQWAVDSVVRGLLEAGGDE